MSLRDTGVPMTVGELALHTGLSRPTVDAVLAELVAHGTVQPTTRSEANAPGRPARRFVFDPTRTLVAGIDVGARSIRCTLSDAAGTVLVRSEVPSSPDQCPDRIEAIVEAVRSAFGQARRQMAADQDQRDDGPAASDDHPIHDHDEPGRSAAGRHAGQLDDDHRVTRSPAHADPSADDFVLDHEPRLAAVGLAVPACWIMPTGSPRA